MLTEDAAREPLVIAIGGFDPTGGAGVVRDFLTARTFGVPVRLIPTAWTRQSSSGVHGIEPRGAAAVEAAVREALVFNGSTPGPVAIKIGMLPDGPTAAAVGNALRDFAGPVVLDPVLAASSGGALFSGDPALLTALGRMATLVTPNAIEAEALSGVTIRDLSDATTAALALRDRGCRAVLVKGGHLTGTEAVDVLVSAAGERRFQVSRVAGPSPRGTGCALATAVAVGLGRGLPLEQAISEAKNWMRAAIAGALRVGDEWHLGNAAVP